MAASALVEGEESGSQLVSEPIDVVPGPSPQGTQLLSISPGCTIVSPTLAWSLRANMWLLLSRYWWPLPSSTSEPRVPPQQSAIWLPCVP